MSFSEEEKKKIMEETAKQFFQSNDNEVSDIRNDITNVVETTIGKCSASEDIIQNVLLTIENHYGEIDD
jgi:Holliday junction resolvase-like predicted endonuclease